MGGVAIAGSDYTLSGVAGQVTISAGQTSATVVLHSLNDQVKERNENAAMTIRSGTGYKVPKRTKAVVTIVNAP